MRNIYIADDDADDTSIFEQVIGGIQPDIMITSASNGYDLFATLEKNVPPIPDLIFLDINMPKLNGHDTLDKIKKDDRYKNIPVIIYSTSTEQSDMDKTYAAGANNFITKPPDFGELKNIMKKVLSIDFKENYQRPDKERYEIKG